MPNHTMQKSGGAQEGAGRPQMPLPPLVLTSLRTGASYFCDDRTVLLYSGHVVGNIRQCLNAQRKSYHGFEWREATESECRFMAQVNPEVCGKYGRDIPLAMLRGLYAYNARTGELRCKRTGRKVGHPDFDNGGTGVIHNGRNVNGARIAWALHNGHDVPQGAVVVIRDGQPGSYALRAENLELRANLIRYESGCV